MSHLIFIQFERNMLDLLEELDSSILVQWSIFGKREIYKTSSVILISTIWITPILNGPQKMASEHMVSVVSKSDEQVQSSFC